MKIIKLKLAVFFLIIINANTYSAIYFVDSSKVDNTGDGLSWNNAKKDLQEAINSANPGDSIWIKKGTYFPTRNIFDSLSPANLRHRTFYITKSLHLFGGFSGVETDLSSRNIISNLTSLDGDIGVKNNKTDNCTHVLSVIGVSGGTIDGLTITNGNANTLGNTVFNSLNFYHYAGGGIYLNSSRINITNCFFINNSASIDGGGYYSLFCQNTVKNNRFLKCGANSGGALFCTSGSTDSIIKNTIDSSTAPYGGGIYSIGSQLYISENNITYSSLNIYHRYIYILYYIIHICFIYVMH